ERGAPVLREAEPHHRAVLREGEEDDPADAELHAAADERLARARQCRGELAHLFGGDRHGAQDTFVRTNADQRETTMQITRTGVDTNPGPRDWFTGAVFIDPVATPSGASRLSASSVHFTPGARTAWHTHPNGQTIYVLEGQGLAQRRGGPVEVIRPGDRVFFEPGEEHWHGATPTRFMTHLALLQVDDQGNSATWGEHVTD